ncbi:MAG: hypothetical protein QXJ51_02305 [Sulfolobales archaeon]
MSLRKIRVRVSDTTRWLVYVSVASILMILSILLLILSIGYMQSGLVATSLLTALIGFTMMSGALYMFKISAYVYSLSKYKEEASERRE